ncbi:RNA-binding protein MEX3B [Papilio xuthus]|uniref:RNA-binding protein MEX3B n=1 Tax=Papilio xuthus TaxID=66420 RepID=A0A194PWF5_PAPXU|nr:RNA-binding protein MEX3B [Papilio xuthus]
MPSSLFGELGGGGLVEDQSAFRLALELSMLSLGEPMPTTNPLASPIGFAPPPDDRAKKSQNMTECVPVPSSEHVAEIVGRQGTVCLRLGSDRRRAPPPPLHKGARVAPARSVGVVNIFGDIFELSCYCVTHRGSGVWARPALSKWTISQYIPWRFQPKLVKAEQKIHQQVATLSQYRELHSVKELCRGSLPFKVTRW